MPWSWAMNTSNQLDLAWLTFHQTMVNRTAQRKSTTSRQLPSYELAAARSWRPLSVAATKSSMRSSMVRCNASRRATWCSGSRSNRSRSWLIAPADSGSPYFAQPPPREAPHREWELYQGNRAQTCHNDAHLPVARNWPASFHGSPLHPSAYVLAGDGGVWRSCRQGCPRIAYVETTWGEGIAPMCISVTRACTGCRYGNVGVKRAVSRAIPVPSGGERREANGITGHHIVAQRSSVESRVVKRSDGAEIVWQCQRSEQRRNAATGWPRDHRVLYPPLRRMR